MSLDQLARSATSEVRGAAAARDGAALRLDLDRRLARHRRRAVALAVAVVLAIVLGGVTVAASSRRSSAPPVAPNPTPTPTERLTGNGPIVVTSGKTLAAVDPGTGLRAVGLRLPASLGDSWGLAISPDGTRLVVDKAASGPTVYDLRSGRVDPVHWCDQACWPSWSPDGRRVVVSDARGLAVVDVATGARSTLIRPVRGVGLASPSWSADGTRIAYVEHGPGGAVLVIVRSDDGSPVDRLVLARQRMGFTATWSPDGTRIALLTKTGALQADGRLLVEMVPVTGDRLGPVRVVREVGHCFCVGYAPGIAWSPDGQQLAVNAYGGTGPAGNGLNLMNADGSDLRYVVAGSAGQPAWQPVAP